MMSVFRVISKSQDFLVIKIKICVFIKKMTDCKNILCSETPKIVNSSSFRKWALKNHPDHEHDENKKKDLEERFKIVKSCKDELFMKNDKIDCESNNEDDMNGNKKNTQQKPTKFPTSKQNLKKAVCIRTTENWSHIDKEHRFDKRTFNVEKMLEDIPKASPKMHKMIEKMRQLDEQDMKKHGKLFKHFIFSDVKAGGYGAKIIASGMIANGFNSCFKPGIYEKIDIQQPMANAKKETFGILCSTSVFNNTYTKMNVKKILSMYNSRPDNIYGDKMRFIIFDSGFKEGIDLFDVKYVHLFETQQNSADLTQAVGRATRSCGQKGLDFVPNKGWTLEVYQYYSTYGNPIRSWGDKMNSWYTSDNASMRVFDKFLQYKGVDLNKLAFKENLEKLAILSAVDYDLNYNINKFEKNVTADIEEILELEYQQPLDGGEQPYKMYGCNGGKCGSRSTKSIPFGLSIMEEVYKTTNKRLPKNYRNMLTKEKRAFFCKLMEQNNDYCKKVNMHFNEHKNKTKKHIKNTGKKKTVDNKKTTNSNNNSKQIVIFEDKEESAKKYIDAIDLRTDIPTFEDVEDLRFDEFQEKIKTLFKKYKYAPIKIENQCVDLPQNNTSNDDRIVKFTESQEFISRYFTPSMKQKGMLIWHSVGTGKTCTAIATKSFLFEKKDYSILWVTRNTLREDIWKNMFEKVCDYIIREQIQEGEDIPKNPDRIRKYVSKMFLPPMSYRQFSNTLLKKNDFAKTLLERNGKKDMLHKTLIIIDEAHKLYGTDLIAAERPNMNAIESMIFNSHKNSGKDSCKLMLMTATPIADDSMEFMKLLNLVIGEESKRFPVEFEGVQKMFIEENTNSFSTRGKNTFQNKIKGLVSYLNRQYDPRQFTQPVFHEVPVYISEIPEDLDVEQCKQKSKKTFEECKEQHDIEELSKKYHENNKELLEKLTESKTNLGVIKVNIKETMSQLKSKSINNEMKSTLNSNLKKAQSDLIKTTDDVDKIKTSIKQLKSKYSTDSKKLKDHLKDCLKTMTKELKDCSNLSKSNDNKYQDKSFMRCYGKVK